MARNPPQLAAAITALIAALVLTGWTFDLAALKRIIPGLVAMNPMRAVAFLLAAVSLGLFSDEKSAESAWCGPWLAHACTFTVALIGVAKLAAIFDGPDVQIDRLLFLPSSASGSGWRM